MRTPGNLIACLALFVALGGTATAAATLARDSVASREIRDGGVRIDDVSAGAQTVLRGQLRFARADAGVTLPRCEDDSLSGCQDHLALPLASPVGARTAPPNPAPAGRNWLVEAKLQVAVNNGSGFESVTCGLVDRAGGALDTAELLGRPVESSLEHVSLAAVVRKPAGDPTVALRCSSDGSEVVVSHALITAREAGNVTRP